ncbi:MAG: toxins and related Ca2+-binding protein-like protein [Frankiales bacterium]|nr:toxins and related Ca2+-binding protein-like protein [Frankiales bacterium]
MARWGNVRTLVSGATVVAMIGTYGVAVTVPASAATPQEIAAANSLRDAIAGSQGAAPLFDGLTSVGAFGTAEPALTLVPSDPAALGTTPLADALTADTDFGTADSPTALKDALNKTVTLPDGPDVPAGVSARTATFSSSLSTSGGVDALHVDVVIARPDVTTGIRLHSTTKPIDFTSVKGVTAQPALHLAFDVTRDVANGARLLADPTIAVDTTAALSGTLSDVRASLGILGVTLGTPPTDSNTWTVATHLVGGVRDPNNDGFLTTGPTGEIGAKGASAGLGTVSVRNPGGGTLEGRLYITPRPSTSITNLPGATIDVTATSANLASDPSVDYADGALAPVEAFQRLAPFDLAQGVAQLAVTLDTIEHARPTNSLIDVDLPLTRGSLADLVPGNEALQQFLSDHVTKSSVLGQPGQVDFASVQDFLDELAATQGPSHLYDVTITGADFVTTVPSHPKLVFTVNVHRGGSDQPTDPLAPMLTAGPAGVTYGGHQVSTSFDFATTTPEFRASLAGRQVNAGGSSAVIHDVSGTTINLDPQPLGIGASAPSYWKNGTPSGVAYTIEDGDAKTGNVELGDALKSTAHLSGANSAYPQATTHAGYDVALPLVLDLEPAVTGAACATPANGNKSCPYQVLNPDGSATVIAELPARPDRIMLDTGTQVLTARSSLSTPVDITAPVGFVPVRLGGTLALDAPGTADNMQVTTAALGDIPLGTLINKIHATPDAALTGLAAGTELLDAHAALTLDVVRAPTFFHTPAAPGTAELDASAPSAAPPTVTDTHGDLADLAVLDVDTNKPSKLFDLLLADLGALNGTLTAAPSTGVLGTPVPVLGSTLGQALAGQESRTGATYALAGDVLTLTDSNRTFDAARSIGRRVDIGGTQYVANGLHIVTPATTTLPAVVDPNGLDLQAPTGSAAQQPADGTPYSLVDDLSYSVDAMTAAPPSDLDQLIGGLEQTLGAGAHVTFTVDRTGPAVLKLHVLWPRTYSTSNALLQTLTLNGGAVPLAGHPSTGEVPLDVTSSTDVTLVIPLTGSGVTDPLAQLKVDPTSSRTAHLTTSLTGTALSAAAGSFELDLGSASAVKADLSAAAAGTGSSPVSLGAWTTGLSTALSGTLQSCASGTDGAVCASLPATAHADGADLGLITVTVPTGTTDLSATIGGTDPLAAAIQASTLDLGPLGGGLQNYLDTAKDGLDAAIAGGKVPLIGKDLQEGTDFIGKLKAAFATALPAAKHFAFSNAGDVRNQLQAVFNDPAITGIHVLEGAPSIALACDAVLAKVSKPGVTAVGAPDADNTKNADYTYAVAAYHGTTAGQLSDASASVKNLKVTTAGHHNDVSWAAVPYADSYKLYRNTGSGFGLIATVAGTSSPDDFSTAAGAAPVVVTSPPDLGRLPCADSAPAPSVAAVTLSVKLGQGVINPDTGACANFDADNTCLTAGIPIDLGLPGISLRAQKGPDGSPVDGDKVTARIGWTLDLALTLDKKKGFLVETTSGPQPELKVGASITLPATLNASVSFIKAQLTPNHPSTPELGVAFTVDLGCSGCAGGQLSLPSLLTGGATLTPKLKGAVNIDEHFATGVGAPGDASYDPSLPGLSGDFKLLGTWSLNDPLAFSLNDGDSFGFFDVKLEAGKFLRTALGPIVQDIITTLKPVQPILDTISAPIPVLSDLSHLAGGDDVTLVTLAQAFGGGSETVAAVLQVIKTVKQINTVLQSVADGGSIDIGSLTLRADTAKTTAATPDAADNLTASMTAPGGGSSFSSLIGALNTQMGGGAALSDSEPSPTNYGFTFPALKHPADLLKLLVGKDVEIAHFDSGPVGFDFTFSQQFGPVYAPPPVLLTISGSAGVSFRIAAGFDTYGIRQAVERGKLDVKVLDSLYFVTKDDHGQLIPVVHFTGELAAGAEVSVAFLSVGVEGGLRLTVDFTWNDPNNDGKFRFSEFLSAALQNPICLFNVGGRLSLFLKIFVTIGFSPFSVSFDFTLADITLLDFSLKPDCTPPPPKLGGTKGGVLYLFAGVTNGSDTQRGAPWGLKPDAPETWVVRQQGTTVTVQALGISEDFTGVDTVVLDARNNNDKQRVIALFQGKEKGDRFSDTVVFFGGQANDVVKTDTGPAFIDGGAGDDSITTGDRPLTSTNADMSLPALATAPHVVVAGNGGNDHITVGNAIDAVAGDGQLSTAGGSPTVHRNTDGDVSVTAVNPTGITLANASGPSQGNAGNDVLSVGLGGGHSYGGPGGDQIAVAQDSPLAGTITDATIRQTYTDQGAHLYGGTGPDRISAGAGDDKVFTGDVPVGDDAAHPETSQDAVGTDDLLANGEFNTVDTGIGNDVVVGANGADLVTGHSRPTQSDIILGLAGEDVLTGGDGTDKVYGGRGDDYLVSQPADVTLQGADTVDVLGSAAHPVRVRPNVNPGNTKTLVGGGGSDRIYGGDGASTIFGDHVAVACAQVGTNRSDGPDEDTSGYTGDNADGPDLIYGGDGVDTIQAGGGNDWVFAKGGADTICGMRGDDHLYGGDGNDTSWGGRGSDVVQGDGGNDLLYGNEDNDSLFGNDGTDVLEGNAGQDSLFGGQQADVLIGGTSQAGRADVGDFLYGDEGTDTLIGDNGDPTSASGPSFDLSDTGGTLGGADVIAGGAGNDSAYGGLANDTIDGNADDDHLEGGPGVDTIHGNAGRDDVIGGSSQLPVGAPTDKDVSGFSDSGDKLSGDSGDDVVLGDNGQIIDTATVAAGDLVGRNRAMTLGRTVTPYDLGDSPVVGTSGGDVIDGGGDPDLLYGQGGSDTLQGATGDDYLEGGPGFDHVYGDAGQDDLVGGSQYVESGTGQGRAGQPDEADVLDGGSQSDVVLGDNGIVHRDGTPSPLTQGRGMTARTIELYDLGDSPVVLHAGGDLVLGGSEADVLLGQGGSDVVQGGAGDDYTEGGPGTDRVEGNAGDDDLVGGSSTPFGVVSGDATAGQLDGADLLYGGTGDDVALGDNGILTRVGTPDPRTFRIGSSLGIMTRRSITAYDLSNSGSIRTLPARAVYGNDQVSGGSGVDLLLGQDGADALTGEAGDDYVEGNGGNDAVYGDSLLPAIVPTVLTGSWQPRVAEDLGETDVQNGQDDLIGGSSRQGFRDALVPTGANDLVHGDGGADYELGDNGQIVRDVLDAANATVTEATDLATVPYPLTNRVYAKRYPASLPDGAAFVRHGVSPTSPTRFCSTQQSTCEPTGAFGNDTMYGDAGDDTVYGQDGNDTLSGNDGNDDLYGELGNDSIDGGNGDDAILGDRGGIVDTYQTGSNAFTIDNSQVPKLHYDAFQAGTVTRQVDLQHDVNGDAFLGSSTSAAMAHRGDLEGGDDQIRGRAGHDSIHGGFGDDLANGDSGGDTVYGDDGADVLWGGKGSDDPANPNDRGVGDSLVDYIFGGKGGDAGATKKNTAGADILDWRPRGTYSATSPGPTTCSPTSIPLDSGTTKAPVTVDPCSWFVMTDIIGSDLTNDQHHQGIDWIYGGWDRDVLQGDVADNGPNLGDRLLDWNGTYNLYTHCNAAYGGYNDVRQHSPAMQDFLQRFAWTTGAGQVSGDVTSGTTSAFDELALAYPGTDNSHASGSAFPTTPGHFDNPNACAP